MKKILILAAATFTMVACSNDDNYIDQPVAAQISATISNSAVSRASGTSWTQDDEIGISMTGNLVSYVNQKYTTDNGDGNFTGEDMYFKNHIDPLTLTAYYPFTGDEGEAPGILTTTTDAERQTAKDQQDFDFLYARLENVTGRNPKVKFNFEHKMSKLTFIFKNGSGADVSKITSYKIEGLVLEGTFNTADGTCTANANADPQELSMKVSVDNDGDTDGIQLPPLILFPQKPAGTVKLKLKDNENQDYACTLEFGSNGLISGNNYQFKITINKTGLTVDQSSITDWNNKEIVAGANSDLE